MRIVWTDVADPCATTGATLTATVEPRGTDDPPSRGKTPKTRPTSRGAAIRESAQRIMATAPGTTPVTRAALLALAAGEDRTASLEAIARLTKSGLLSLTSGLYQRTDAGRSATETDVDRAVGSKAGYTL